MTKILTIKPTETLEEVLTNYAKSLTDSDVNARVKSVAIVAIDEHDEPFFTVLKAPKRLEFIGALESLKLFLLQEGDV